MKWHSCVLFAALAAGCASQQRWRETEPQVANVPSYQRSAASKHALDNGVGVFVSPLQHPSTTRVALVFAHGYLDDHEQAGYARLLATWLELEALAGRAGPFDALGARVHATTMTTATVLEVDVLSEDAAAAVTALAGLVQGSSDALAFESARRTMLSELRQARRTPQTLAHLAALQSAVRGGAPGLGHRGLGSVESLERARFEDILHIRDRWVASVPVSLAVVGPHEAEEVTDWARATLSRWTRRAPARTLDAGFARRPKVITVVPVDDLEPAVVLVGTTTPRSSPLARGAYQVGRSFAHLRLREGQQRTYGVNGDITDLGFAGFAYATARVPAEDAYGSALTIAAAFGRSSRVVNQDAVDGLRRLEAAHWTASKLETKSRAQALYRVIAFGDPLHAEPPFGPLPSASSLGDLKQSLANDFSYAGMQIVIAGDLEQLSHQLRGTTFQVRTDVDLLGPEVLPEEPVPAPATLEPTTAPPPRPDIESDGSAPPPAASVAAGESTTG